MESDGKLLFGVLTHIRKHLIEVWTTQKVWKTSKSLVLLLHGAYKSTLDNVYKQENKPQEDPYCSVLEPHVNAKVL